MRTLIISALFMLMMAAGSAQPTSGTWEKEPVEGNFADVVTADSGTVVAVTTDGIVYVRDVISGNGDWTICCTLPGITGNGVRSISGNYDYVYVTTYDGKIFKVDYRNCLASLLSSFPTGQSSDISWASESVGYVCGAEGTIRITTDGGNNWQQLNSGVSTYLSSVYAVPGTDVAYIAGDAGTLLKTSNSGQNWTSFPSGTQEWLDEINPIPALAGLLLISGSGGFLSQWDGSNNFTLFNTNTTLGFNGFSGTYWSNSPYLGINVGDFGSYSFLFSADNSLSQIYNIPGVDDYLKSVATYSTFPGFGKSSDPDTLYAIAAGNNGLYKYTEVYIPTGQKPQPITEGATVWPNPASGPVTVSVPEGEKIVSLQIRDCAGRVLATEAGEAMNHPDMSTYGAGVRLLTVVTSRSSYTVRIIVQ